MCNVCRHTLAGDLDDIPLLWDEFADRDLADHSDWTVQQDRRDPEAAKPRWLRADADRDPGPNRPLWVPEPGYDPIAAALPSGPIRTSTRAQITGSPAAPDVTNLDIVDLTSPPTAGSMAALTAGGDDTDRIGNLPIAAELYYWTRRWCHHRDLGEHPPAPTVADLVAWLAPRLPHACDTFPAIDHFAYTIRRIKAAMRAVLGLTDPPKALCVGVPCRSCSRRALYRDGAYVQCDHCGQFYSERDYADWTRHLAAETASARRCEGATP